MRKRNLPVLLLWALLPLLAGCAQDTLAAAALRIEIQDAHTGASVFDVTVVAQDGEYADTALISSGRVPAPVRSIALLAENRSGTYDVTITHPQYRTWHRSGIRVTESGVRSPVSGSGLPDQVYILAKLEPVGGS